VSEDVVRLYERRPICRS